MYKRRHGEYKRRGCDLVTNIATPCFRHDLEQGRTVGEVQKTRRFSSQSRTCLDFRECSETGLWKTACREWVALRVTQDQQCFMMRVAREG
jgi:hypothetical protein